MDGWKTMTECRLRIEAMIDTWPDEMGTQDRMAEAIGITDHEGFIRFIHDDVLETLESRPLPLCTTL